jgi:pyridoxine kinase
MKAKRPDLVYVCDPVMGDDGRLYVPRAFVDVFRNQLVPLAGVLTPNQTEAELLSGIAIRSLEDAQRVLCALHAAGPQVIVIKSLALRDGFIDVVASSVRGERRRADGAPLEFYHMQLPRFAGYYSGTGDLASALLLGNLERFAGDLTAALEHSMASVRAILTRTVQLGRKELALVQSRADIEVAPVEFRASALPNRL